MAIKKRLSIVSSEILVLDHSDALKGLKRKGKLSKRQPNQVNVTKTHNSPAVVFS